MAVTYETRGRSIIRWWGNTNRGSICRTCQPTITALFATEITFDFGAPLNSVQLRVNQYVSEQPLWRGMVAPPPVVAQTSPIPPRPRLRVLLTAPARRAVPPLTNTIYYRTHDFILPRTGVKCPYLPRCGNWFPFAKQCSTSRIRRSMGGCDTA